MEDYLVDDDSEDDDDYGVGANEPTMNQPEDYVAPHEVEEEVIFLVPTAPKKVWCWPHKKSLFPMYNSDIKVLLTQVAECECVKQPTAVNTYGKGNKWAKLHENLYGGGDSCERGAMAFY